MTYTRAMVRRGASCLLALLWGALSGCFGPGATARCAITCVAGDTCPGGTPCGADSFCHDDDPADCPAAPLIDAAPVIAGETCAQAPDVEVPGDHVSTTAGRTNDYAGTGPGCWGADQLLEGPDVAFAVTVPGRTRLVAGVLAERQDAAIMLVELATCAGPEVTCLSGDDSGSFGSGASPDVLTWVNPSGSPARLALIVDARGLVPNEGPFVLHLELADPAHGDSCDRATVLSATPGTLAWETTHGFGEASSALDCGAGVWLTPGPDRFYAITIPAEETRVITVTPGPTTALILGATTNSAECAQGRFDCTIGSWHGVVGGAEVVTLVAGPEATTYYLQVDGGALSPTASEGAYTIAVSLPE